MKGASSLAQFTKWCVTSGYVSSTFARSCSSLSQGRACRKSFGLPLLIDQGKQGTVGQRSREDLMMKHNILGVPLVNSMNLYWRQQSLNWFYLGVILGT